MASYGEYIVEVEPGKPGIGDKPSVGPAYGNSMAVKGFSAPIDACKNLYDAFQSSVNRFGASPCLGKRIDGKGEFVWETFKEVETKVISIASGLAAIGIGLRERAAVFSVNCPEWMITLQACNRMNICCIPLYDTLEIEGFGGVAEGFGIAGPEAIEYCMKHSESKAVFVSAKNWSALMASLPEMKGQIRTVIYWGSGTVDEQAAVNLGIKVYKFADFLALGQQNPAEPRPPQPEDLSTIMYTSGTTGPPKGVMIPQTMVMSCMRAMTGGLDQFGERQLDNTDVFLSFLPLAHIFDMMIEQQVLSYGVAIGYYSGDVKALVDDIAALRPTLFIGVPRVYDRIYAGVIDQVKKAGGLKKFLFDWGSRRKLYYMKQGYKFNRASPFFDKLVFSKIKQRLGGRVKIAISGAAPLAPHVEEFMSVALCCKFSQGYGLTETCGSSFYGDGSAGMSGSVGVVQPGLQFRLESIPEMKYNALDESAPKGEICIRGGMVSKGYYKDPEKTAEVFDRDGWFHTGDVGQLLPSGALKIIDRKKQIFKLAQGEYVAVERVEANYKKLAVIQQIFAYGNSMESMLVAVIVPEESLLVDSAKANNIPFSSYSELLAKEETKSMLLKQMDGVAKECKMKGFERIRGLILEQEPFGVDNGLMTPTFKLKRHHLQEKYIGDITNLYKKLNAQQ